MVEHQQLHDGGRGNLFGIGLAGQPDGDAGELDDLHGDGAEFRRLQRTGEPLGVEPAG